MRSLLACLVLLIWFDARAARADDWPFFAGPMKNGHAPGERVQQTWPEEGPPVLWARDLGQGYSSFAVVGERCLTQYQTVLGQFVVCLDAATGRTLWESRYDPPYEALGIYPGPRSTPTVDEGRVYFTSPDHVLGCLDLATGRQLWKVDFGEKFSARGTGFGYAASPLVLGELVILPVGGKDAAIVAFSKVTGEVVWKAGDDPGSYCTAIPIVVGGRTLLFNYLENAAVLHDLTGRQLWKRRLSHGYDEHSSIPVYVEPILVLTSPFKGGAVALRLQWKDQGDKNSPLEVTQAWSNSNFSNDIVSSLGVDEILLGFDLKDAQSKAHRPSRGMFRALDVMTGKELWSNDAIGQASLIWADNRMIAFNDSGQILLTKISRERCEVLSRVNVFKDEVCWTRPALSGGRLFLRTHSKAVCLVVGREVQVAAAPTMRISDIQESRETNWMFLVGGEREHPFMLAGWDELGRWFRDGLVWAIFPAVLLGLVGGGLWRLLKYPSAMEVTMVLVCVLTIVLGIVATPWLNGGGRPFTFTWPAALAGAMQAAVCASMVVMCRPNSRSARWASRGIGLAVLALAVGYFYVLRKLSMPLEWMFLMGFLPAALPAAGIARLCVTPRWWWLGIALLPIVYSALFWGAAGLQFLHGLVAGG